jgi:hypothetical protein
MVMILRLLKIGKIPGYLKIYELFKDDCLPRSQSVSQLFGWLVSEGMATKLKKPSPWKNSTGTTRKAKPSSTLARLKWVTLRHTLICTIFNLVSWQTVPRHFFFCRYNPLWVCILQPSSGAIASSRTRFLDHTQRRATVGRTPLDEGSVRRRDLYLTTHNTHNR